MKKIASLLLTTILLFMMTALSPVSAAGNCNNIHIYPLKYSLETEAVKIDTTIPVVKGITNVKAQEEFNRQIRDSILGFATEIKAQAEKFRKDIQDKAIPFRQFQAVAVYHLKQRQDILSLLFEFYRYTDGAHGMTRVTSYNLDVESGQNLSLAEILTRCDYTLDGIKAKMVDEIKNKPGDYFPDAVEYIQKQDTFNYYLEDGQLVIYYQQYDIAPYAAGNQEFRFPLR